MTQIDDPRQLVKILLEEEFNTANLVGSFTPVYSTGWFNEVGKPIVTVSNPEESPVNGGDTGFTYSKSDGTGGAADVAGTVQVNCWAHRGHTSENPKQVTWDLSEEVKRIANDTSQPANHSFTSSKVSGDNLGYLSWFDRDAFVEERDDEDEPLFRFRCLVGYGYLNK